MNIFKYKSAIQKEVSKKSLNSIRKSDLPIVHIKQASAVSASNRQRSYPCPGADYLMQLPRKTLQEQLNEHGGCMFQIAAVAKSLE
jgi:hypothetical protein